MDQQYSLLDQAILPVSDLISLAQLMLRWPFECFRKISFMVNADICPPSSDPKHKRIKIYLATRLAKDHNNHECLSLVPSFSYVDPTWADNNKISQLFFRRSEVEEVEAANPDLALNELISDSGKSLLVCRPDNIEKVATLTLNYLINFKQICDTRFKRFSDRYPDPIPGVDPASVPDRGRHILTAFHNGHYSFCLGSALRGDPDESSQTNFSQSYSRRDIMPRPPLDGVPTPAKNNKPKDYDKPPAKSNTTEMRDNYIFDTYAPKIASWILMGQNDPRILARYLNKAYHEIRVGEIGFLLPATLFPIGKVGDFIPFNYVSKRDEIIGNIGKKGKTDKRGQRLLLPPENLS